MANEYILNNDVQISGSLNVSQSISASAFYGDGSNLLYVTASSQWNGILTGSADITGSLTVRGGDVDLRLSAGVTGSFSGSFEGDGSGLTGLNLNGYQASGSILSGSFSGSFIGNGSGLTGVTASFLSGSVSNATTASLALTASYLSGTAISSSYAVSSSFANTASYCNVAFTSAQTASYVNPLVQNVQLTGSLDIVGSQSISSTVTVSGKIQSETGVDILATNGVYWKGLPFSSTAIGGVNYNNGISFFAGGIVTPRMFISSSGNVGIATTNPSLGRLQVQGNVVATSFTGSLFGTASYATTASYALNGGGGGVAFPYTGSALITGSLGITGSLSQGSGSIASGNHSHAEGYQTKATTLYTHAEGFATQATGTGSHAEGIQTSASADYAHAEGQGTIASGIAAHSEGSTTQALGEGSHAEGYGTLASGSYSHAEGKGTQALGEGSHTGGYSTVAKGNHQFVAGQFNITSSEDSAFIIGGGGSDSKRSNLIYASPATGVQVTGSLGVYGPVYVGGVLQLTELNPLPSGSAGMLAISSSGVGMSLFFHDGQDWQVLY